MPVEKLLIANRGEIAIRIARAAEELGIPSVAIYSTDDHSSLHTKMASESHALEGSGVSAYLNIEHIVDTAIATGCDAVHPGYGFLAENADFAAALENAGLTFVGPEASQLALFGNKVSARELAAKLGVPLVPATAGSTSGEDVEAFLEEHKAIMIKAVAGGGGRGMREVRLGDDVTAIFERCQSEALSAFGVGDVYAERLIENARHIEVQIIGDGTSIAHVGERECTLQRQNQKIIEIAPSPSIDSSLRALLTNAATEMASEVGYRSLGTWEFLVDADDSSTVAFIETNARLQVEHTVTEEITGIDLVRSQLAIAGGSSLTDLNLQQEDLPSARGFAIQCRVNTETMTDEGLARPGGGTMSAYEPPSGPGIRVDSYGYQGYATNPSFDSLIAKVIGYSPTSNYEDAVRRAKRALSEFRVEGVPTNITYLLALLERPEVQSNQVTTRFISNFASEIAEAAQHISLKNAPEAQLAETTSSLAGAQVSNDPLAVLQHGDIDGRDIPAAGNDQHGGEASVDGTQAVEAPLQGTIISIDVAIGDEVAEGQPVAVMEAMKMEHVIASTVTGIVHSLGVTQGDTIYEGHPLLYIEEAELEIETGETESQIDLDFIRPDLQEVFDRHYKGMDEAKPSAVEKRHGRGHRTARENLSMLVDEGTFVEYGPLMVAAQRRRRSLDDLIDNTQGDGMVAGIGSVNGDLFDETTAQTMVMSYDYMVLAGTQGLQNHRKKDRLFEIAEHNKLPTVLLAEGGGGRPGDTDTMGGAGLDCWAFTFFARLSGLVPLVGVTNGRCFAGNAVLLGCCDVIIATEGSNIGIGGPAMIEGGGLGVFRPEEVGPVDVQYPNGVIDILVKDEEEAMETAKRYLSYFQGPVEDWEAPDQRLLRHVVPENRLRAYDVREVIETMCDVDSVLELRKGWGPGCVTALARVEGHPIGIIANNNHHLGGAIDADVGDKGSRFMQLCDAHDIPLVFLCDTPGIMVGPQAEYEATVRHAGRMFVTSASVTVPFMTVVLRKGYGLGAQAMAGGSFKAPVFCVSWPTGEFGGMGLEGFVKLGYRKELESIEDPAERIAYYEEMVAKLYENGKAVSTATFFELDDVIDPAETRTWISMALKSAPEPVARHGKKRPMVDTW